VRCIRREVELDLAVSDTASKMLSARQQYPEIPRSIGNAVSSCPPPVERSSAVSERELESHLPSRVLQRRVALILNNKSSRQACLVPATRGAYTFIRAADRLRKTVLLPVIGNRAIASRPIQDRISRAERIYGDTVPIAGITPASAAWWTMASHLAAQDYLARLQGAAGLPGFPPGAESLLPPYPASLLNPPSLSSHKSSKCK